MNNASEMNPNEHNRDNESDNSSLTENECSCEVISEVSAQLGGDPEVIPLTPLSGLPVEAFDFELLPSALRPWAVDMQHRLQCPADYVGVSIMIALATAVGNKVRIQPKANDHSWKVVPNLWGLLIGSPSSMKSPAMNDSLKHIVKMDEFLRGIEHDPKRLIVRDSTIEQVQVIQELNPTGILYLQDEISSLFRKFDHPSSNDRQYLLEAFNGSSSYSVDRISRPSIYIEKNTLSLIGTIQPDVLQSIFLSQSSSNDGFMQRLQLAVWPDPVEQEYVDEAPNEEAERQAWSIFTNLYQIKERTLLFCTEAQAIFVDWFKQTIATTKLLAHDGKEDLASHITKYRKLVPALALLIELAENTQAEDISEDSMIKAVLWVNYLITHAKRVYGIKDKAAIIAQLIFDKKDRLQRPFSPSEVTQNSWSGLVSTDEVRLGIELLERHNYLIKVERVIGASGGRPSEKYRWNSQLE